MNRILSIEGLTSKNRFPELGLKTRNPAWVSSLQAGPHNHVNQFIKINLFVYVCVYILHVIFKYAYVLCVHTHTHEVCPESIQPRTMKNRDIYWKRYKIQETLYTGQWCLSPLQSRNLGTSHSSLSTSSTVQNTLQNPLLKSPPAALLCCPESHQWSEICSLSKVILVLGKCISQRAPNLGHRGLSHLGDFMFC